MRECRNRTLEGERRAYLKESGRQGKGKHGSRGPSKMEFRLRSLLCRWQLLKNNINNRSMFADDVVHPDSNSNSAILWKSLAKYTPNDWRCSTSLPSNQIMLKKEKETKLILQL